MSDRGESITMRDAFLQDLTAAMSEDDSIMFLSADFGAPLLDPLRRRFPKRFVNVGIAEQNLINVTTGFALEGFKVFAYAIAPFLTMRCYEQIRVNLAILGQLRSMNVNMIGVGAGLSYVVSGPTHQCLEDLTVMRCLPNVEVFSPADSQTVRALLSYSLASDGVRYMRFDSSLLPAIPGGDAPLDVRRGFRMLKRGRRVCIVATGYMTHRALDLANCLAAEGCEEVGVMDVYGLSDAVAGELAGVLSSFACAFVLEEGFTRRGGLGTMVLHALNDTRSATRCRCLGMAPTYRFELVGREELHRLYGVAYEEIKVEIRSCLSC